MKRNMIIFALGLFFACAEAQMSYTETAQTVVESFYQKDLPTLQEYTTQESFESFLQIQEMFPEETTQDSNFQVLQEVQDENTAWVKFTTAYEEAPETFKLIKEDGKWKVTEIGISERAPF